MLFDFDTMSSVKWNGAETASSPVKRSRSSLSAPSGVVTVNGRPACVNDTLAIPAIVAMTCSAVAGSPASGLQWLLAGRRRQRRNRTAERRRFLRGRHVVERHVGRNVDRLVGRGPRNAGPR